MRSSATTEQWNKQNNRNFFLLENKKVDLDKERMHLDKKVKYIPWEEKRNKLNYKNDIGNQIQEVEDTGHE